MFCALSWVVRRMSSRKYVPRPWDVVECVWEDAALYASSQFDSLEEALASYRPMMRTSVGYWVGVAVSGGRRAVLIAVDDDRSATQLNAIGGISQIPEGMIREIRRVRATAGRAEKA